MGARPYAEWLQEREDLERCSDLLREGSKTFHLAARALPRRFRQPSTALYAFCRVADDAIDGGADPRAALIELSTRLDALYDGSPWALPADRAFARVAQAYAIPREIPAALLEGFAWDAEGRHYPTISEVRSYATRVAGTVGLMMAMIMKVQSVAALARACDLGIAMQLTNIARDVGEDARAGRLYLPHEWLAEAGIDPAQFLAEPRFDARLAGVVARLLAEAELFYERAGWGIRSLPASCRPAINAARLLYAEIGRQVERHGLDSVSQRAVVSRRRKLARLWEAFRVVSTPHQGEASHSAPEAQFLLDAAIAAQSRIEATGPTQWAAPGLDERVEWLMELFERLERRQHAAT